MKLLISKGISLQICVTLRSEICLLLGLHPGCARTYARNAVIILCDIYVYIYVCVCVCVCMGSILEPLKMVPMPTIRNQTQIRRALI